MRRGKSEARQGTDAGVDWNLDLGVVELLLAVQVRLTDWFVPAEGTMINGFLVLACHLPELDGFDQHFQATVLFPLTPDVLILLSYINNFSPENNLRMLGIEPMAAG